MRFRSRWLLPLLATIHQGQVARASLVDDIVDAIVDAVDCPSCHALLVPLKGVALLGDGAFSSTIIAVCKVLNVRQLPKSSPPTTALPIILQWYSLCNGSGR